MDVLCACLLLLFPFPLIRKDGRLTPAPSQIVLAVGVAFEGYFVYSNSPRDENLALVETAVLFDSEEAAERLELVADIGEGKNAGTHEIREDINEKGSDISSQAELPRV